MKKGKSDGITEFAHNFSPDFAACIFVDENNIRHIKNSKNIPGRIFLFILNTNILKCFIKVNLHCNFYESVLDFMKKINNSREIL